MSNVIDGRLQPGGCDPDNVIVVIVEARAVGRALCLVGREMTVQDRARMVLVTFVQMLRRKCRPIPTFAESTMTAATRVPNTEVIMVRASSRVKRVP